MAVPSRHNFQEHQHLPPETDRCDSNKEVRDDFVEHQGLAPEVVRYDYEGKDGLEVVDGDKMVVTRRRKGFVKWALWVVLVLIVIGGVVVGVVLGTRQRSNSGDTQAATSNSSSSSIIRVPPATATTTTARTTTTTPSPSAPTPTLKILQAIFGGADKTGNAQAAMLHPPNIVVNLSNNNPWLGNYDPLPGQVKCLSLLHSYGSSLRTFVGCERDGDETFTIAPGPPNPLPYTKAISRQKLQQDGDFAVVSVVWGAVEIVDQDVYEALVGCRREGREVRFTSGFFGVDGLVGYVKTGVVFYTEDNYTSFRSLNGVEGSAGLFPD